MRFRATLAPILLVLIPSIAPGQQPLTRQQAVEAALSHGPRAALARADTSVGAAQLLSARARDNPALSASYSKSTPHYHAIVDLPVDISGVRGARIRSAEARRLASQYRFKFEQSAAILDADTTYTRALGALARLRLAHRTATAADSLRRMAMIRRDAGDASDLDVLLATVNAGQAANLAAADSLTLESTLLDLQAVMGLDSTRAFVIPIDSLTLPESLAVVGAIADPLPVVAAREQVVAADLSLRAQRRSIFSPFSLQAGIEQGDPAERGLLPTFGLSIPLPILNRNKGPIAEAQAERERAQAELALVRFETRATIGRALRQRSLALEKIRRDGVLVESANRMATMSLTAYREGAQGLPAVLEAQRNAREILSQYVDDLVDAWIATSTLRLYSLAASIP
jgi:cobalt-zinc-cadmium efflux system outer membrane protein